MSNAKLIMMARDAAKRAYCPYSQFRVGAAVECIDGQMRAGCNIENASYGLTVCAERVAIFNAVSDGLKIKALAVSCPDVGVHGSLQYQMPCGACRQVMTEFMPLDSIITVDIADGGPTFSLDTLLPHAFSLQTSDS